MSHHHHPTPPSRRRARAPHRRTATVVAALLLAAPLAACGSDDEGADGGATAAAGERAQLALIVGSSSDDFYAAIECGAKREAEAQGVDLDVQGPGQFDPSLQIPIVNAVAAKQPDAIIIAPTDDTALEPPLQAAVDAGSQLVLVDTNLANTELAAGHIGSDYVLYGQQGGEQLAELIGGTGKVLGIFSPPGVSTNDLGRQGFTKALEEFPDIEVLPFEVSSGEAGRSATIVSATLAAHPDLAGVFTYNGGDAQGVVTALREAGATERVPFVSGDAQPFQVEQLQAGEVQALIVQQAGTMGQRAVQYALDAIAGDDVPAETALPTVVGTRDNLEDPEVADNLYKPC